jgi:prolipoprotein diacylglyceryl transferase
MELLAAIIWNVDREIVSFGNFALRWYGLLFALGFVLGYQIMYSIYIKEGKTQKQLDKLSITMIVSTVVGARLGHCLFYEPEYYLSNPIAILKIWEGGLASHGAAIAILIGLFLYVRNQKDISLLWLLDRIVIVIPLAGALIRLGNFFNSEIYGIPTDVPWAVIFQKVDDIPRHPVQLYESFSYLIIFIILYFTYKNKFNKLKPGFLFGLFLVSVFGARFFIEFFKSLQSNLELGMPIRMGQILSIPFIIIGIYFILRQTKKN